VIPTFTGVFTAWNLVLKKVYFGAEEEPFYTWKGWSDQGENLLGVYPLVYGKLVAGIDCI